MSKEDEIEKVKNKLLYAAGKYSDYERYYYTLYDLEEQYDETLEIYDPEIWEGESNGTIRGKAEHMLRLTSDLFSDLRSNARVELMSVLREIMEFGPEEQKQIWKRDIFLDKDKVKEDKLEDAIFEWEEEPYAQEEALEYLTEIVEAFVKEMRE